jgi:hypothetical protein
MDYAAAQIGRHMFYFVVNKQPSSAVIAIVFAQSRSINSIRHLPASNIPARGKGKFAYQPFSTRSANSVPAARLRAPRLRAHSWSEGIGAAQKNLLDRMCLAH